jgi:hypothetical protein
MIDLAWHDATIDSVHDNTSAEITIGMSFTGLLTIMIVHDSILISLHRRSGVCFLYHSQHSQLLNICKLHILGRR